jgi:hypothetical protein
VLGHYHYVPAGLVFTASALSSVLKQPLVGSGPVGGDGGVCRGAFLDILHGGNGWLALPPTAQIDYIFN